MAAGNMQKKLVKFGRVVFQLGKAGEWTDRQTDRHTHHNTLHPFRGRSKYP